MLNYLHKISSLKNLGRASANGQIATLLILVVAAVLIFVLITVNLGQVSLTTTKLSNAADSAALALGSQLATKAHTLYESLGGDERCVKGGLFTVFLAIIFSALTIWCPAFLPFVSYAGGMMAASSIAGAVGGAIGGLAIQGTLKGMFMGALEGASIGAAMAWGASLGATQSAVPTLNASTKAVIIGAETTPGGIGSGALAGSAGGLGSTGVALNAGGAAAAADAGGGSLMGAAANTIQPALGAAAKATMLASEISGGVAAVSAPLTYTTASAIFSGLTASSKIYSEAMDQKITADGMSALIKDLNGLSEEERYRENVFLNALSRVVDDPNYTDKDKLGKVDCDADGVAEAAGADPCDADGDGDTEEVIPYFQYWFDRRAKEIKEHEFKVFPLYKAPIAEFLNGPLQDFSDFAQTQYPPQDTAPDSYERDTHPLARWGIEGKDGVITHLFRALYTEEDGKYKVSFWKPGPDKKELNEWYDKNCPDCAPPEGYDESDSLVYHLQDLVDTAKVLAELGLEKVVKTRLWIKWFYDANTPDDLGVYYNVFNVLVNGNNKASADEVIQGLVHWKEEIEAQQKLLPQCEISQDRHSIKNPPCWYYDIRDLQGKSKVYTTRAYSTAGIERDNYMDDFTPALEAIQTLIDRTKVFYEATKAFAGKIEAISDSHDYLAKWGGDNPVTYSWNDTRCPNKTDDCHSVEAGTMFEIPTVRKEKHNPFGKTFSFLSFLINKTCLVLTNGSDDGSKTYVEIKRTDPSKTMKPLGSYNPNSALTISRKSRVAFDHDAKGKYRISIAGRE